MPATAPRFLDYRNFAVHERGRIPKVEDWEVELPRNQSASILKHREMTVNVPYHSTRFLYLG
jgi:hypothetical protein